MYVLSLSEIIFIRFERLNGPHFMLLEMSDVVVELQLGHVL